MYSTTLSYLVPCCHVPCTHTTDEVRKDKKLSQTEAARCAAETHNSPSGPRVLDERVRVSSSSYYTIRISPGSTSRYLICGQD